MRIEKYICPGCKKEHTREVYESQSEGVARIFTENYFQLIWDMKKDKLNEMPIEEFCKELVLASVFNYHKNRRRIRIEKSNIEPENRTDDKEH